MRSNSREVFMILINDMILRLKKKTLFEMFSLKNIVNIEFMVALFFLD